MKHICIALGMTGRFGRKGIANTLIHDDASNEISCNIEQHFTAGGTFEEPKMISQVKADPEALADMIEM